MLKQNIYFIIFLTFIFPNINAQNVLNQTDVNGKRHGTWQKNFKGTKQLRYQGQFAHGKEVGVFKFYKLIKSKSVLTATKEFNTNNTIAEVTFFASDGQVISKGKMNGKLYVGEWQYFHNDSDKLMTKEYYNDDGKLDGEKLIFFKNGQIAEQMTYLNGKEDGNVKHYNEKGILTKDFNYKNGELHGLYKDYSSKGDLIVEGQFKEDKKHGRWKFYKNGELVKEKNFSNPKTFHKN